MNQVTIYTSKICTFCAMAKRLLANKGISPVEIDVGSDVEKLQAMMERTGRRTVPQIFIGDKYLGGYDDLVALDRRGGLGGA